MMKESDMMNNTNTHSYMQAEENVTFTHTQKKKGIKLSGEREISVMIKIISNSWMKEQCQESRWLFH